MPNATCIYLYEGERAPVVFDTAVVERERRSLADWLAENPELESLVEQATALTRRAHERRDTSNPEVVATKAVRHFDAFAELRAMLPRLVAAREELAVGAGEEAASILYDLEVDLAGLLERAE